MDKFESLRAFTTVVKTGSFAGAAREMRISRSAAHKLVANLEKELGARLFHRSTRRVTPTTTGLAFYERCATILADLAEAEIAVSRWHEEPMGVLRVNAPMSFGVLYLAPLITEFMIRHPRLQVQLTLDDRLIDPISEGFDFVLRVSLPPQSASLAVHPLASIERILCASDRYLSERGLPAHPSDLRKHSCLHYGYMSAGNVWKLNGPDGEQAIPIEGALCSNNGEVLREAALKGLGIALLPTFLVARELRWGTLRTILPDYSIGSLSLCAIYPTNRHLSITVRLFTEFLRESFGRADWMETIMSSRSRER
ncbi:MAG: LysR family transcriptional regulator [Cyanobacteria bacterium RI_101]|nr:LysR family transcriptional regulator [Cyanobacteria bacterium RI_101]